MRVRIALRIGTGACFLVGDIRRVHLCGVHLLADDGVGSLLKGRAAVHKCRGQTAHLVLVAVAAGLGACDIQRLLMSRLERGQGEAVIALHKLHGVTAVAHVYGHCRLEPQLTHHAPVDGHEIGCFLRTRCEQHPLVADLVDHIARKGNQTKKYFKIEDYKKEETKLKGWAITYIKGLGSLEAIDFKEMLQHPILHKFSKDDLTDIQLRSWFAKDNAQERKSIMKDEVE